MPGTTTEGKSKPKLAVAKATDKAAASAAVAKSATATGKGAAAKGPKKPRGEVAEDTRKITVKFTENPGREGTLAHKTRALYKTGQTVKEWREACKAKGGDPGYLAFDVKKGYVTLSDK